jgi:hypothetical protein
MSDIQLKHCPICTKDLPVSEFGMCRARKDGKNLYCRACINAKVTASRLALKQYKAARKRYLPELITAIDTFDVDAKAIFKMTPVERVRDAINNGFRTQREIAQETKLHKDVIGDALANLLLWTKEIETRIVNDTRQYFIRRADVEAEQPQRKDCVLSLSCLGPLIKHERVA